MASDVNRRIRFNAGNHSNFPQPELSFEEAFIVECMYVWSR